MPFEIIRNDITKMKVDAIVNAANSSLWGGGGVDGAIHRAAGPELLEECRKLGGCSTGKAKITKGYNLPAKYVIHTVGPMWNGGGCGEKELLCSCYTESLLLALKAKCSTVAFPLISAGVYGYPKDAAMEVAINTISRFVMHHDMTVYLVIFGSEEFGIGKKLFQDIAEYIDDVYVESQPDTRQNKFSELYAEGKPLPEPCQASVPIQVDWNDVLRKTDEGFSQALMRLIDERGITDAECYRRANVDRKLFSKIRSNIDYRPSKPTVFAFALSLRLSVEETRKLLEKAGFALTHSSRMDIIMEYCLTNGIYDVFQVNEVLFSFDLPLLGSGTK